VSSCNAPGDGEEGHAVAFELFLVVKQSYLMLTSCSFVLVFMDACWQGFVDKVNY